jgi:hypothetical protein
MNKIRTMRIGNGYDIHRLVEGRDLILGGVPIPFEKGLLGHSDADVLTHAIMDALLGALALGDIGQYFPPTEEQWRGANSLMLLQKVMELVQARGSYHAYSRKVSYGYGDFFPAGRRKSNHAGRLGTYRSGTSYLRLCCCSFGRMLRHNYFGQ